MSLTLHTTISHSNLQLIIDALAEYSKQTGIDLSQNPFSEKLQQSNTPDAILELLQEREQAFKEYRNGNRRLINCLSPAVRVLHVFSGLLGEATNLVSLSPAKAVFVGIDVLLAAASGVSSSYDALLELFECLGSFLKRLDIYTNIPPTPIMTDLIVKIMLELLSVLALATKQIRQGRFKKFAKKLLGGSEVEAVLQRLDRMTQDEIRIAVAQILSVVHGLVTNTRVVMEDGKTSTDTILQALGSIQQMIDDVNEMKRGQFQKDVRLWLSPPDPSTNHRVVWKGHHKGTTEWFFQSSILANWRSTGPLLWIHGKPGCGKSTLMSAIVQDIAGRRAAGLARMAYYYFDFRDDNKQDIYGLLSSLLSQLSARSDSCYEVLSKLYSVNASGTEKPDSCVLTQCVKEMLHLAGQPEGPIYIIIDALDECPDSPGMPSPREEVLQLVEELVSSHSEHPDVRLCVASRPEIDIRKVLGPLHPFEVSLHDEGGHNKDISKFIESVVYSDRKMQSWREDDKRLVIKTLSEKAGGMFRWVYCQMDRLRRTYPASIRNVLEDLPKSLDETYGRTLLGIDEERQEYAQRLFRCLTISIRPLRVEELAEIFAIRFDEAVPPTFNPDWRPTDVNEAVLSACSSLVSIVDISGSQIVQFSHFSVKEFLTSPRLAEAEKPLSGYHILPEPAHTTLARASLSVLLKLDDKIDRNGIDHFPLAPYAARYWIDHALFGNMSAQVQAVMKRLFDPMKPHFAVWVWLYDVDRHWLDSMSEIHPMRPSAMPLYYASLCGFPSLVRHIIAARPRDINAGGGFYYTPLRAASAKGDIKVVQLLLKNKADLNFCGPDGWTSLHSSSKEGHLEIVKIFLDSGADVNQKTKSGMAPLHLASTYGKLEMVQFLIQRDAIIIDIRNNDQETPLWRASANGNFDIARLLLDHGASVDVTNKDSWAPLHTAAHLGYHGLVKLLLGSGARLDARTKAQETPLALACRRGRLEVSRLLLDHGPNVNSRDKNDKTPLHFASEYGHIDVIRLMLERNAHVNAHDSESWTPLHYASANGHLDILKVLVQYRANVNGQDDEQKAPSGNTSSFNDSSLNALWLIASSLLASSFTSSRLNALWLIASLLGHCFLIERGAAAPSRDDKGLTPFHLASKSGHLHVAKFLLEYGVDVDIRDGNGRTSLELASGNGELDTVRFLIKNGADIHTMDNNGSNPLHIASQNGHLNIVRLLIDSGIAIDIRNGTQMTPLALASSKGRVQVSLLLIERGADMKSRDDKSWAPLHFASRHGHVDMMRLLLDRDVDPNIRNDDLWYPLHLASAHGHVEVVQLLVQRGAVIDVLDAEQQTPLGRAAGNGNVEVVCLLIDHGANLHTIDDDGRSPLHAASRNGHLQVVKLLLGRGASVDLVDNANKTAAELASEDNQAKVASFLVEYKANENVRNNMCSVLARHSAQGGGNIISLHTASEEGKLDVVEPLLDRGADVDSRNLHDRTPLHQAAMNGKVEVARLLLERGAAVESRDKSGWTPLHWSSRNGHIAVSRTLIDHGANVNARKYNYWTPLHSSAHNGFLGLVKLLLEHGADIHVLSDEGQTPYQLAVRQGHEKVIDLLREHGIREA